MKHVVDIIEFNPEEAHKPLSGIQLEWEDEE